MGARPLLLLLLGLLMLTAVSGLRCYVCNSRSEPRCSDPIQGDGSEQEESTSNNNYNYNSNYNNNNSGNDNEEDGGLRPVDCIVANNVRQAIDVVGGLLNRLGQRPLGTGTGIGTGFGTGTGTGTDTASTAAGPGQGQGAWTNDVWGAVRWGARPELPDTAACHKVEREVDGDLVTDRGCAPGRIAGQEPCEALASALGDVQFCELCAEDGCNAAGGVLPPPARVLLLLQLAHIAVRVHWRVRGL